MPVVPLEWLVDAAHAPLTTSGPWAFNAGPIRPKILLHTTETDSWPGYKGGSTAPHGTVDPIPRKGVEVHQHNPFSQYGRALVHAKGAPETNRYPYVLQFELIGTCDPRKKSQMYYWPEADDAVLKDLYNKVIHPLLAAFGIPLRAPAWKAYPESYGANNGVRMSDATFEAFTGVVGHEHVAQNLHGDPGAFPWSRLVALVVSSPAPGNSGGSTGNPGNVHHPKVTYPILRLGTGMPPHAKPNVWVKRLQHDLVNHGYRLGIDGQYGPLTQAAVRNYQRHHGLGVDGIAGPQTFGSLEG